VDPGCAGGCKRDPAAGEPALPDAYGRAFDRLAVEIDHSSRDDAGAGQDDVDTVERLECAQGDGRALL
jgi:hypothetical protein